MASFEPITTSFEPITTSARGWGEPATAYIHVPFCAHHCGYCDFAVSTGTDHLIDLYIEALGAELATLGQPRGVESLFVGGGTPTHLSAAQLERLLALVTHWLPWRPTSAATLHRPAVAAGTGAQTAAPPPTAAEHKPEFSIHKREFSIEANPDSLTEEKAAIMAAFGVNRVSIGVQSFQPRLLQALDRQHRPDQVAPAVAAARRHIPVVSLDLIFAVPGSTLADWQADIAAALDCAPEHISTYGLTYEKGTPLWKRRHRGAITPVPEDDELAMYEYAIDRLTAAGYEHYEISNFARPGFRCRHNERYWANEPYYGFGVGAARYVQGVRELNIRNTQLYIRRALAGEPTTFQREELPPRQRAFETIATQLRRADGIDRIGFRDQTGFDLDELASTVIARLEDYGIVDDDGRRVRLTRRGRCVADAAIAEFLKEV
ncbi:MAG: coproporphyrinogen-III oxidase family protein [Gemmataceae bacterium]|nr:coproporphyrinogen III oxidase family protein [Gemmata sp.]MDW8198750.1 coproporphyrinogen-III oxidase family protein [Gemmataceae bacterium]